MDWLGGGCTAFYGGGMMMFVMFLFWGLLIFLGFFLMKNYMNGSNNRSNQNHLNILKERLARGEITEEEYDKLKEKLL